MSALSAAYKAPPDSEEQIGWIFTMFDLGKAWDAFSSDKSGYDRRYFFDLFTTRWPVLKFLALWYEERMVLSGKFGSGGDKEKLIEILDRFRKELDIETSSSTSIVPERGIRSPLDFGTCFYGDDWLSDS